MTSLLIATFCLGCCVGVVCILPISRAIERKHHGKVHIAELENKPE